MKVKGGFSEYFASLKDANDPKSMQEKVLGSASAFEKNRDKNHQNQAD